MCVNKSLIIIIKNIFHQITVYNFEEKKYYFIFIILLFIFTLIQMEQYVFGGSLGSGKRGENRFHVYSPTTTTTTTTSTTTSTRAPAGRSGRMLNVDIPVSGIKSIPSNGKTMLAEVTLNRFENKINL